MSKTESLSIWLLKEGEPLPIDGCDQLLRTGRLANSLASKKVNVHWFSAFFDHGRKTNRESFWKVKVRDCLNLYLLKGSGYKENVSLKRIIHQHLLAIDFILKASKMEKPDLILAAFPTPELCWAASFYAKRHKIQFMVDVRDPWPDTFSLGKKSFLLSLLVKYYNFLLKKSLNQASSIISMSETMLSWSMNKIEHSDAENKVFYLGTEASEVSSDFNMQESFTESKPLNCIFYGMFGKCHTGEVVIEAARILHSKNEKRVNFIMAGDGDLAESWKEQARGLTNLCFTGWLGQKEAAKELRASHVGVITIEKGLNGFWFGNKFFEYLAYNLCIVNDTQGEIRKLIDNHKIGDNIELGSSSQLVEVLESYLNNPKEVFQKKNNSNNLFQKSFDSNLIYEKYADYLISKC